MAQTALIIVDLQNDYFDGGKFPLVGTEEAAANAAKLLENFRNKGDLVVHVQHVSTESDAGFFAPGTDGAEINPAVAPNGGEAIVVKHGINAFQGTDLKALLDGKNIEDVVIAGAMSHMCVDAVTRAASDHGYRATVVHDAVATRDLEFGGKTVPAADVHAAFMSALAFGYAAVVSTEDYLGNA
ncbi:MAG: cysteine hydrolase [Rhizobium sp. 63-7]|nr:MAG: cysteine hydrolase [Rhizobium sp. 63-7]